MIIKEEYGDLFDLDFNKYTFVHCISSDLAMGKGIAAEFERRFNLKRQIGNRTFYLHKFPTVIFVDNNPSIINLVTKDRYFDKPTYKSLRQCVTIMRKFCVQRNIKFLAMPVIGCGLDKLEWDKVKQILEEEFKDVDIEIIVRYKKE